VAPARRIEPRPRTPRFDLVPQPLAEQRVAGVREQLLAGLGVLDQDHAEAGQVEFDRSTTRMATT